MLAPRTRREYERNLCKDVLPEIGRLGPRDVERVVIRALVESIEELRAIFAAVLGTELEDLLPFIGYTAAGDGEARSARWADIDLEEKTTT